MIPARNAVAGLYAAAYMGASYAAVRAVDDGQGFYAAALFALSAVLLIGIRHEYRNAARMIHLAASYRHHQMPGAPDIECATALPPGCRCETWWTSLGARHDTHCPARKDHT
ncbi:hypothetical protein ACPCSP_25810 [Streptomyces cinereoruber]|uniref:hypothetical protein n=1 Tax=Streptomyces cinereoruber TaxID=67260 RepID=UPI003C2D9CC3